MSALTGEVWLPPPYTWSCTEPWGLSANCCRLWVASLPALRWPDATAGDMPCCLWLSMWAVMMMAERLAAGEVTGLWPTVGLMLCGGLLVATTNGVWFWDILSWKHSQNINKTLANLWKWHSFINSKNEEEEEEKKKEKKKETKRRVWNWFDLNT